MNRLHRYLRFIPVTLVMGIIFFLSHQSGTDLRLPKIPGIDKVAHGLAFGVLAAAALLVFLPETRRQKTQAVGIGVVLFCMLYGISDEFHQFYIPGRITSIGDIAADTAGAILVVCSWYWFSGVKRVAD